MKAKIYLFLGITAMCFYSCRDDQTDNLKRVQMERDSVISLSDNKDSSIALYLSALAEIESNLLNIQYKENLLSNKQNSFGEFRNTKNNINEDIKAINNLLDSNRTAITSLNNNLSKSKIKVRGLNNVIEALNAQILNKTQELEKLYDYLLTKNKMIAELNTSMEGLVLEAGEKNKVIGKQLKTINEAYYSIGSYKDLKAKNVLDKEGGILGLGKEKTLKQNFDKNSFELIDIQETTSIPISSKKAVLITNHPTDSYKLESDNKKIITNLIITNPQDFWKASKYLVVVVD
ncbi:MAG: hypothetical protein V4608_02345 [Bacteroidota bacterium]